VKDGNMVRLVPYNSSDLEKKMRAVQALTKNNTAVAKHKQSE
jgi:hypothetical protein